MNTYLVTVKMLIEREKEIEKWKLNANGVGSKKRCHWHFAVLFQWILWRMPVNAFNRHDLHDRLFHHFFVRRCSKCWDTCKLCAPQIFPTTFLKTLRVRKKNQGVVRKNIIDDYWYQNPTHLDLVEIDAPKNPSNKFVEKEFNNNDI